MTPESPIWAEGVDQVLLFFFSFFFPPCFVSTIRQILLCLICFSSQNLKSLHMSRFFSKVLKFVELSVQTRKVHLISTDMSVGAVQYHWLPVDTRLRQFTISLSGDNPNIVLRDPNGKLLLLNICFSDQDLPFWGYSTFLFSWLVEKVHLNWG